MTSNRGSVLFVSVPLSRRQRIRRLFTWHYIRQTRLFMPLTDWWLNRGL